MTKREHSYWDNQGRYQQDMDRLWDKLVPARGEASTPHGEVLRAISRITHELYNNGGGNFSEMEYFQDLWVFLKQMVRKFIPPGVEHLDKVALVLDKLKVEECPVCIGYRDYYGCDCDEGYLGKAGLDDGDYPIIDTPLALLTDGVVLWVKGQTDE